MTARLYPVLRVVFAIAGLAFIGLALRDALRDPDLTVLPPTGLLLVAVFMVVVGLLAAIYGWARLLDVPDVRIIARGFLLAQLGKYIPGGVWQVVGQVGDAARATAASGQTTTLAFVLSVATQATAGALVGLPLAWLSTTPMWIRIGIVVGAIGSVSLLLERRLLSRLLLSLPWLRDTVDPDDALPSRGALVASTVAGIVSLVAAGLVFQIAWATPAGTSPAAAAIAAYALAWTIGFLAVPFPAGLGVREAALLLLLPDESGTAIVAASAITRVVYIVGELVALGLSFVPGTRVERRAA